MEVRTKAAIIIVVGIAVIAVIAGGFIWLNWGEEKMTSETAPVPKAAMEEKNVEVKLPPPTAAEKQAGSLSALAKTFAERFGSFSNQSGYLSIDDLVPLMTPSLADWVESAYVPKLKKEHDPNGFYYQISAEAAVIKIVEQADDAAEILVTAQRLEKTDSAEKNFSQDILLELKKVDGAWLVDGAYWQSRK